MLKLASLLLIFVLTCFAVDATLDDQVLRFNYNCTQSGNYTPDSNYQYILYNLLGSFTSQASNKQFYNLTLEQLPDLIYGLYLCRGDVVGQNCSDCVTTAKNMIIKSCPYRLDAIIWFDYCLVRYSPNPFFGKLSEYPSEILYNSQNITGNLTEFKNIVESTMLGLVDEIKTVGRSRSEAGMMYVTKVLNLTDLSVNLYAMEQCTNDLTESDCVDCLNNAIELLSQSRGGNVLFPSCVIRYEIYPFFRLSINVSSTTATHANGSPHPRPLTPPQPHKRRHLLLVSISIALSNACFGILFIIWLWICKKKKKAVDTSHYKNKRLSMAWEIRFKIIAGVARGLLYLHEDSRLKIVHRDLKPSNILLDEDMNPKIADFGLAKLFGMDQTQGDTNKIVGTYGYMAPEYAMTGHFSVKSDVYSFGVIVLEIVSGQQNRLFNRPQLEEALLHRAWRLWNERTPLNLVHITRNQLSKGRSNKMHPHRSLVHPR
ncbi:hypothetical protein RND81_10G022900 [Saponaria officinalis]|uniref:Cysteine-rich receptor-like protein kinase 10 n=1 Tax=Saponaria officinalis TaxID=3572 RepID=A0AAW1HXI1_SAPOF